jgi:peptidoglycan-associated lipoprotein
MTIKTSLLIAIAFLFSFGVMAQRNNTAVADDLFEKQQYSVAVDKYKKAYSKTKDRAEKNRIRFQMAECYRYMNVTKRAEATYKSLVRTKYYKEEPVVLLHYANMLKINQKYDEAIPQFEEYIKLKPDDPRGSDGMKSCQMQQEWVEHPTNHQISNLSKVNSREDEFSPTYGSDNFNDLIFTSNREGSTGKDADEWTGANFTDLFYTRIDRKNEWSVPDLLESEGKINSPTNEGSPMMNSNFTKLYFVRCGNEKNKESGCHIYTSEKMGRNYSDPEIVNLGGDSTSKILHPSLSDDELMIFFTADFPNGYGGTDIYYATRKGRSEEFGRPKNIGPVINTVENEGFPFLRSDTVLYFASNGHIGMGGLDIFKSTFNGENWGVPVNIGYPMNSSSDDFSIIFHPDAEEEGFFCSNRKEMDGIRGKGGDDIWYFVVPPLEFSLFGIVKDDRTLQFLPDATVQMVGSDGSSIIAKTNSLGRYEFGKDQFLPNTTYDLSVTKDDYFTDNGTVTTVGVTRSKEFQRDFILEPIPKKPIVLPEILYDLAKWDLKPQYQDSLQGLIQTLDENPTLVVELASHTDARDSDEKNDILSQKRAQSVVDYLILRGIDPERLVAKGYGERVPRELLKNYYLNGVQVLDSSNVLTEEFIAELPNNEIKEFAHQLNRRSEFSVLRNDFVPKEKLAKVVVPTKVDIVVNPEIEVSSVPLKTDAEGRQGVRAEVNSYAIDMFIDKRLNQPYISLEAALNLLRDGAISKDDFAGDPNEVLANSSIMDKAVFLIEEIKVDKNYITMIEVTVSYKIPTGFYLDEATFNMLGKYRIDEEAKEVIFE